MIVPHTMHALQLRLDMARAAGMPWWGDVPPYQPIIVEFVLLPGDALPRVSVRGPNQASVTAGVEWAEEAGHGLTVADLVAGQLAELASPTAPNAAQYDQPDWEAQEDLYWDYSRPGG